MIDSSAACRLREFLFRELLMPDIVPILSRNSTDTQLPFNSAADLAAVFIQQKKPCPMYGSSQILHLAVKDSFKRVISDLRSAECVKHGCLCRTDDLRAGFLRQSLPRHDQAFEHSKSPGKYMILQIHTQHRRGSEKSIRPRLQHTFSEKGG